MAKLPSRFGTMTSKPAKKRKHATPKVPIARRTSIDDRR